MPEVSRVEPMDQSEESGTLKRSSNETQDTVIPGKKKTLGYFLLIYFIYFIFYIIILINKVEILN